MADPGSSRQTLLPDDAVCLCGHFLHRHRPSMPGSPGFACRSLNCGCQGFVLEGAVGPFSDPAAAEFGTLVIDNSDPLNGGVGPGLPPELGGVGPRLREAVEAEGAAPLRQVRREIDPKAIAAIEELLRAIHAGEARACAYLMIDTDGELRFGITGLKRQSLALIGAIEQLKHEAMRYLAESTDVD